MWISLSAFLPFWHLQSVKSGTCPCAGCLSDFAPDTSLTTSKVIKECIGKVSGGTPSVERKEPVLFAVMRDTFRQWDRKHKALPLILIFIVSLQFCSCEFYRTVGSLWRCCRSSAPASCGEAEESEAWSRCLYRGNLGSCAILLNLESFLRIVVAGCWCLSGEQGE